MFGGCSMEINFMVSSAIASMKPSPSVPTDARSALLRPEPAAVAGLNS